MASRLRALSGSLLLALLPTLASAQPADDAGRAAEQPSKAANPEAAEQPSKAAPPEAADEKPLVEFGARLHAGWELEHLSEDPGGDALQTSNSFYLRRARMKMDVRHEKWLRGQLDVEVGELFELSGSVLRDGYVEVRPLRQLRFRMGQFQRPFSGLELRSSGRLKVVERGDGNELIVEDLRYGDRDLGVEVFGRLVKDIRLDYQVGVFNGSGRNLTDDGVSKDVVGRLGVRPTDWLRLGSSGAYKRFDDVAEGQPEEGWAAGGDFRLRMLGIRLYGEAMVGLDHTAWRDHPGEAAYESPLAFDALGILSRRFELPVSWRLALEPVFKMEFLDPNAEVVDDHVLSLAPGLNTYLGQYFRVMVHGELRHASRNAPGNMPGYKVMRVLGCLDI